MILVITNVCDPHADAVITYLNSVGEGGRVIRWHPQDTSSYRLDLSNGSEELLLVESGRRVDLSRLTSVWVRRPFSPGSQLVNKNGLMVVETLDLSSDKLSVSEKLNYVEGKEMISGVYEIAPQAVWYSRPSAIHRADRKVLQLKLAEKLGFSVPPYVITNSKERALQFIDEVEGVGGNLVIKPISPDSITVAGSMKVQSFSPSQLRTAVAHFDDTFLYLQLFVRKAFDVRVTMIGDDIVAAAISNGESFDDWRDNVFSFEHKLIEPPDHIVEGMKAYLKEMKLNFGAWDFSVSKNGEWNFLECNPNGQWLWIEALTGAPLVQLMGDHLRGLRSPLQ